MFNQKEYLKSYRERKGLLQKDLDRLNEWNKKNPDAHRIRGYLTYTSWDKLWEDFNLNNCSLCNKHKSDGQILLYRGEANGLPCASTYRHWACQKKNIRKMLKLIKDAQPYCRSCLSHIRNQARRGN